MTTYDTLSNQFLIAMPQMADPSFMQTLTLLCTHSETGAMGVIVNRRLDLELGALLDQLEIPDAEEKIRKLPVYYGGPVEPERGFILHRPIGDWDTTLPLTPTLGLTASRDILVSIAHNGPPHDVMIMLGYAGWGPGQLETEMRANSWLTAPANEPILFEVPPKDRWKTAARQLGVDLDLFTSDIGHA